MNTSKRTTASAVTTLRPPERIAEKIAALAAEKRISRSEAIRITIEQYRATGYAPQEPAPVRVLYARLNSKLVERPITFSCPPADLAVYRQAATEQRAGSVTGLLSLAVSHLQRV